MKQHLIVKVERADDCFIHEAPEWKINLKHEAKLKTILVAMEEEKSIQVAIC